MAENDGQRERVPLIFSAQIVEQSRRAGEQSSSERREMGPKSQFIRDHSQCEKTNEQACFKEMKNNVFH